MDLTKSLLGKEVLMGNSIPKGAPRSATELLPEKYSRERKSVK